MKYIVYLTTNLKSKIKGINRIYVGVHKTENPDIFDGYIGSGVKINSPSTYMNPKTPFLYAVKKYGVSSFKREILYIYNTAEEAYNKEAEIVDYKFLQLSFTYNIALGGHGGDIIDSRVHCYPVYLFDLLGLLIKFWETTIDASDFYGCMASKINKAINGYYEYLGYFWARKDKITLTKYKTDHKKYTYLYNRDGKMIGEFISRTECAKYLECLPLSVSKAVKLQLPIKDHYVSDSIVDIFIPKPRISLKNSYYFIYDVNNKFYGKVTKEETLKILKINTWKKFDTILNSNGGWYKDFFVSDVELEKVPDKKLKTKMVNVYSKEGELVETLYSVKDVKSKYNLNSALITKLLKGVMTHSQYIFKYSK